MCDLRAPCEGARHLPGTSPHRPIISDGAVKSVLHHSWSNLDGLSLGSSCNAARTAVASIRKTKPLFTRAHPPASPRLSPVSPLEVPLSYPSPPAAGELGRRPARRRAGPQAQACSIGAANVWDGCPGTVATLWHTWRRFHAEGGES